MIAAFFALLDPPPFVIGHEIWAATEKPFITPAKSQLFNLIEAANVKPEMKNTKYMMAYQNGKSSVRVCIDLTRNIFEGLVGIEKSTEHGTQIQIFKDLRLMNMKPTVSIFRSECFQY